MTWKGALNHSATFACLLLGILAGLALRSEGPEAIEATQAEPAPPQIKHAVSSTATLDVEMTNLIEGSGNLANSPFLQDLLNADAETLIRLLEETDGPKADQVSMKVLFRMLMFGRLAELDADVAWDMAKRSGNRETAIIMALAGMWHNEPAAAIAARIEPIGLGAFRFMWKNEPKKVLEILEHFPKGMDIAGRLPYLFTEWTKQDAIAAQASLDILPSAWRNAALDGIVAALLEGEPTQALNCLRELAPDELGRSLRYANVKGLILHDSAAVENFMETLPNGSARRLLLAELFASKLDTDKEAAMNWLEKRAASLDQAYHAQILLAVDDHPDTLAKVFIRMPESLAKLAVPNAVREWMKKDPDAANAWVASLPETRRHSIEQERFFDLANSGSQEPLTVRVSALAQIEDSGKRDRALQNLGEFLAKQEDTRRQKALATVVDDDQRAELRLAMQWSTLTARSREADREAELSNIRSPELQQRWRVWMAEDMSQDPAQAVAWLGEQSDAFYQNEAHVIEFLAMRWTLSNPAAASAWIATIPASEGKDRAIKYLIGASAAWEPEAALAWAAEISDGTKRIETATHLLRQWSKVWEAEAREALAQSEGFSNEERARLSLEVDPTKGGQP